MTGAAGLLGGNLVYNLASGNTVLGIDRNRSGTHGVLLLDLLDFPVVERAIADFRPDVVVNCAALADVDACEKDEQMAMRMNYQLVEWLTSVARRQGATFVQISTDAVFSGSKGQPYSEDDAVGPLSAYGRSKKAGEDAALSYEQSLVVRTTIFGWNLAREKTSFGEWLFDVLLHDKAATLFTDVFFTPIYVGEFARLLHVGLAADLKGLYHLAGRDTVSKAEFGRILAQQMHRSGRNAKPGMLGDINLTAPRSRYMSLDSSRFQSQTGARVPTAEESAAMFLRDRLQLPVASR